MVKINLVYLRDANGTLHKYRSEDEFSVAKFSSWRSDFDEDLFCRYISKYIKQARLEEEWEEKYELPKGALAGAHLLLGGRSDIVELRLRNERLRQLLSAPGAIAQVYLNKRTTHVVAKILSLGVSYATLGAIEDYMVLDSFEESERLEP